jgi:hypothetical protein
VIFWPRPNRLCRAGLRLSWHYAPGMAKAFSEWKVLPHGPIEKLAENLWWVQGSLPGMSLKRVMVIARMNDGRLVVHNGIALEEAAMKEIEAFGKPAFLVVPNGGHRLDAPAYKKRYPELKVVTPKGSRERVEQVLAVDLTFEEFPSDETVRFETLRGVAEAEGAMIVKSSDGTTVVLNDAMFNMDKKRDPLGWFFTTLLGSAPGPRVSRLAKLVYIKDAGALRAELLRFAELPELERVIVAHEKVASGAAAAASLRTAATYL